MEESLSLSSVISWTKETFVELPLNHIILRDLQNQFKDLQVLVQESQILDHKDLKQQKENLKLNMSESKNKMKNVLDQVKKLLKIQHQLKLISKELTMNLQTLRVLRLRFLQIKKKECLLKRN